MPERNQRRGSDSVTLILALKGSDGLVLAADSRGTYGDPRAGTAQNDSMVKVHQLSKHAGLLITGDSGLGNQILAGFPQDRAAAVSTPVLVEAFRQYVRAQHTAWFQTFAVQPMQGMPVPLRPQVSFVIAGYEYDSEGKSAAPVLYSLPTTYDFAPVRMDHGFALDGIAQYALYLFNRLYRDGYSTEQLQSLAAYAITETASQDGKVGGPIRMATISPEHGYQGIPSNIVENLVAQNVGRSEALRKSFFGEDHERQERQSDGEREHATS